jgi:hypothetical protein
LLTTTAHNTVLPQPLHGAQIVVDQPVAEPLFQFTAGARVFSVLFLHLLSNFSALLCQGVQGLGLSLRPSI